MIHTLDQTLTRLSAQLSPRAQSALARQIGQALRRANQQRIKAQQNPDGTPWQPRKKPRQRAKMMQKLRRSQHLRLRVGAQSLRLGFFGNGGRIAQIHHYGKQQLLSHGMAHYPARELIGITDEDKSMIESLARDYLAQSLP